MKTSAGFPKDLTVNAGFAVQQLDSWKDFIPLMQEEHSYCPGFIYRGQCDANWKVESALDRMESRFPKLKNYGTDFPEYFSCPPIDRDMLLEAFKECVRGKRGPSPRDLSEDEWWALAQHHSLTTPLLDWACSPFVALFFAFEDEGYVDWKNQKFVIPAQRAVYAASYLVAENGMDDNPAPTLFCPRREVTSRLSSQTGVLMKMPRKSDLESSVNARYPDDSSSASMRPRAILTKIVMPNEERPDCLKLLDKMNINRLSLFGDLDGAARYLNSLWELDFPTALGRLPDGTTSYGHAPREEGV